MTAGKGADVLVDLEARRAGLEVRRKLLAVAREPRASTARLSGTASNASKTCRKLLSGLTPRSAMPPLPWPTSVVMPL